VNLQLALDRLSKERCMEILYETERSIDWIEIGTGVIKEYGTGIIREIKNAFPSFTIVADMKTCDAGKHEAIQAFEAGADISTVMAFSADQTIKESLHVAKEYNGRIMVDLLNVQSHKRVQELTDLGVELVSLHLGKDMQRTGQFDERLFSLVQKFPQLDVAIAGGINLETLPQVLEHKPMTIIVGSAITKREKPSVIAAQIKGEMDL
jgi:3-hexulose-6-phosphate synthase